MALSLVYAEIPVLAPNEWLRRPRRIRRCVLAAVAMIAFDFILALRLASLPNADGGTTSLLNGLIFFLVFAAPCVWFAWRIARSGLWIRPGGLLIRGPLRVWRIQPSEAVRFVPGVQRGAGNGTPCPMLERLDGPPVGVWALGREGWIWRYDNYLEGLEPLCDRLNRLLDQQYPEHPLPVLHQ